MSLFETNIRLLGGLLSAHDILPGARDREMVLQKAVQLADRMILAFQAPSGLPDTYINLATGATSLPDWSHGSVVLAEVGTLQVEFKALTDRTGDNKYAEIATVIMDVIREQLQEQPERHGLAPTLLSVETGEFTSGL